MAHPQDGKLVTIFGGSGFVGRHIVRALARRGWRIRAAVRRPDLAQHLQPLGAVGQIMPVQANLRDRASIERALAGSDAVINAVGILAEGGKQRFMSVHAQGARDVAEAAKAAGVKTLVQISAIGADAESPALYGRSKAKGEESVFAAFPEAVILRPSIIFGPEDDFFNRFGAMAQMSPVLPLVGGETKFQPVFVGDVAEAAALAVEGKTDAGAIYELGGPEVRSFRSCIEQMLEVIDRKRLIVDLPLGLARFQARFLQLLPKAPLTVDQVDMLGRDNVVSEAAIADRRTLDGLGIAGTTMAAVLPTYLQRFRPQGQFTRGQTVA
ncbi:MAG: complex I NDUFA9 subunit family protein [Hyphomicrobiales bacterium]|nr:MAG: complex I NDUFA9 subunit family protein [Hyphomicrobiales bacterium]